MPGGTKPPLSLSSNPKQSKAPIYRRKWFIAIVVILLLGIIGSCSGAGKSKKPTSEPSQAASTLSDIKLRATTEYLEYSNKDVDPTTLVTIDNEKVTISSQGNIDLTTVGTQNVTYKISLGDQTVEQTVEFIVRDTKAPKIKLSIANPEIDQDGSYDPHDAITSVADEVDGELALLETAPEPKGKNAGMEVFYDEGWYILEGSIDFSTPGTYPITITASDKHGNVTTKELSVTVKDSVKKEVAPTSESAAEAPAAAAAAVAPAAPAADTHTYVLNTNTQKFHVPGCASANKIKASNKSEFTGTRDEIIARGYQPCKNCNP